LFLCCLALLHFAQQVFCDDLHRTWCILPVHERVRQCFWAPFGSNMRLSVLESDPWSVLVSLSCHVLPESGIFTAWIFLRSSAMALYLSICNCTDLMIMSLFHGIFERLEWTLSLDQSNCRLSVVVGESTS
jgi:hypothetical protein